MVDRVADAINAIKTHEMVGRRECVVYSTKLIKKIMDALKREGYINGYSEYTEGAAKMLRIGLSNRINSIGVIKPRFKVSKNDITKYESRYVPSKDMGTLIITTSKGILTSKEAAQQNVGGRLLAYVY
ncbi:MAG: 30S ribosomal protein S8 [Candidatus Micrarchaeaceae archaeon]